jgi:DNA-binding HxlR family transcriptional regulator
LPGVESRDNSASIARPDLPRAPGHRVHFDAGDDRMLGAEYDTSDWPCTIARSASILGDHWNLLLIRQACQGTRRFGDFQAALGVGRNILSQRLGGLVEQGLFTRVEYQRKPSRYEYRLTDKGREVYPILAAMAAWGDRWLTGASPLRPRTVHLRS